MSDKKQACFHDKQDISQTTQDNFQTRPWPWLREPSTSGRIPGRQSGRLNPEPNGRNGIPEDCGAPEMGHFRFPSSLLWFTQSLLPSYRFPSSPPATRHLGRSFLAPRWRLAFPGNPLVNHKGQVQCFCLNPGAVRPV